jgi:hypothetical protein
METPSPAGLLQLSRARRRPWLWRVLVQRARLINVAPEDFFYAKGICCAVRRNIQRPETRTGN